MKLHVFLLSALPMCLAQFSIQGPSDGNRVAQGLKYSEDKGIEYTDQSASLGAGDFTIQGATDGNSNFRIQGATDGHSDFQIQGPSNGGSSAFNIQGATDGHSQSVIQGPYDPNQGAANAKALQYSDPSGLRVNWRSYGHDRQTRVHQPQPEPQQYAEQPALPRRSPAPQSHQPQPQPPVYKSYDNAPSRIKELLQFQAQIPYINIIPEQFRYDALASAQAQAQQVQAHYQQEGQRAQAPRGSKARAPARHRRQAQYRQQQQHQQSPAQPQYRRISQPPTEPAPQYSSSLPSHLKSLLQYQAQIPYNIIANQITYRPEKPYVPQPAQQQQQHQALPQAQYQGQAYTQAQIGGYDQRQQQPGYGGAGVRPVTENQY